MSSQGRPLRGRGPGRGGRGGSQGSGSTGRITQHEREVRTHQLRELLHPTTTSRDVLITYLVAARWDVEQAHARWIRNRQRLLQGNIAAPPPAGNAVPPPAGNAVPPPAGNDGDEDSSSLSSLLSSLSTSVDDETSLEQQNQLREAMEGENLRFNNNVEQERRDSAFAFRLRVEDVHQIVLSISEAVLLMNMADWDIGVALADFTTYDDARHRLRVQYDGTRDNTVDINEQSARVAFLVEITERADWLSMKLALQKKQWNLVRCVINWYKKGIRPYASDDVRGIPKDRDHWGLRVDHTGKVREQPEEKDCRAASEADPNNWAADTCNFTNPGDDDPPEPLAHGSRRGRTYNLPDTKPGSKPGTKPGDRDPGFLINPGPNMPLKPGPNNPAKFLLEYVSKGHYRYNLFAHPKYYFPDRVEEYEEKAPTEDDSEDEANVSSPVPKNLQAKAEFNFQTQAHLHDLNAWRRQNRPRTEGATLRYTQSQPWTQEEKDFFYKLNQEWLDGLKKKFPSMTRKKLLETSAVTSAVKEEWAANMNARFTGTTPPGAKQPRMDRNSSALMTMRGRDLKIAIHFRTNVDQIWWDKLKPADRQHLEAERHRLETDDALLTVGWDSDEEEGVGHDDGAVDEEMQEVKSDVAEDGEPSAE